ncbi:MAG: hypothetical protein JWQ19_3034 [Subtercola sp.]|nr:hypothetical protein [Subtercola sp.]
MTQHVKVPTPWRGKQLSRKVAAIATVPLLLALAACSASGSASPSVTAAAGQCGDVPIVAPNDPSNLVPSLPASLQAGFNGYANPLMASAWSTFAGKKGPLKVGFVAIPPTGQSNLDFNNAVQAGFDKAKAAGLVSGDLITEMPADFNTMTPADQVTEYNDLVSQGVDLIILHPLSGEAMIPSVDAAGAAGIPTIAGNTIVDSKYSVTVASNWFNEAAYPLAAAAKILDGKGNTVIVQGAEGSSTNTTLVNATQSVLAMCPGLKLIGKVSGNYSNSGAQTALTTFMASHPESIDLAVSLGIMGSGTYAAFEQAGRPYPLVVDINASAASLAYWNNAAKATGYKGAATSNTSTQEGTAVWDVAMRTMAGEGPKLNVVVPNMSVITPENLNQFLVPGADTSSTLDALPSADWASPAVIDPYFNNPSK